VVGHEDDGAGERDVLRADDLDVADDDRHDGVEEDARRVEAHVGKVTLHRPGQKQDKEPAKDVARVVVIEEEEAHALDGVELVEREAEQGTEDG